jgi:hypothetical protein
MGNHPPIQQYWAFTRLNGRFVQKKVQGKSILFLDGYWALENIIETLEKADHEKLLIDRNYEIFYKTIPRSRCPTFLLRRNT